MLRQIWAGLIAVGIATLGMGSASAETIRVGVIGPLSGPFSIYGKNFKWGIEAYVAANGPKIGAHTVEFIYRDLESANPAKAKAIAQELIVKDKVQYLAGVYFTPDALAIAPLLEESKTPLILMNAATSAIVQKSPYIVRTSFTMWQNSVPAAKVARARGSKKVFIAVSDYGPGLDAETAFKKTFEADGGSVVEAIRMPLSITDFSPMMQRIKDSGADAVFAFLPGGPPTLGFVKSYLNYGLKEAGVKFFTTGDVVTEPDLPVIGDAGIGIVSTYHYSIAHPSTENTQFIELVRKIGGNVDQLTMAGAAAFDGTRVLFRMIEATDGQRDPEKAMAAVKGMTWESPRGPVVIDPVTRHVSQNVYVRELVREGGKLINKEIDVFKAQPDWGLPAN